MERLVYLLCVTVPLYSSIEGLRASELTYGIGLGSLYNGVGINSGFVIDNRLIYLSVGCPGLTHGYQADSKVSENSESSQREKNILTNCGAGAGFIERGLIANDRRHGTGISFGYSENNIDAKRSNGRRSEYYVGLSYHFFLNRGKGLGWNFGVTPLLRRIGSDSEGSFMLNIGYQF